MVEADKQLIYSLVQKLKDAVPALERERIGADLETAIAFNPDAEMQWGDNPPIIITQGQRAYRAYPINGR